MRPSRAVPGYDVNEDENRLQLAIGMPGIKARDISIKLRHGQVLQVRGGGTDAGTQFEIDFDIGNNIDLVHISANLTGSILVVNAPKKENRNTDKLQVEPKWSMPLARLKCLKAQSAIKRQNEDQRATICTGRYLYE